MANLPESIIANVKPMGEGDWATVDFDPILVGIDSSMGMMPCYHTESGQANPRISRMEAVYGSRDKAIQMAALYGIPNVFFRDHDQSEQNFGSFLKTHQLTVISGPNNTHVPHARYALAVPYKKGTTEKPRFVYVEKPPAHSLEESLDLEELEVRNPGQIAVVAHNRLWNSVLELRHLIKNRKIGDVTNVEIQYQQDWQLYDAVGWRNKRETVGEGVHEKAPIGKLIDILYHALDTAQFVTGLEVRAVGGCDIITAKERRTVGSGGSAFGSDDAAEQFISAESNPEYHWDDVLYANLHLDGKPQQREALASLRVTQTDSGKKNHLSITAYGTKGALSFSTDDPMNWHFATHGNVSERTNYASPALGYTQTLPQWLLEGLDIRPDAPFGYHTPPDHMTGWKETHRKQFQAFALFAQLVTRGVISKEERSNLYLVPTAAEAANVMRAAKAIYEAAGVQSLTLVRYREGR